MERFISSFSNDTFKCFQSLSMEDVSFINCFSHYAFYISTSSEINFESVFVYNFSYLYEYGTIPFYYSLSDEGISNVSSPIYFSNFESQSLFFYLIPNSQPQPSSTYYVSSNQNSQFQSSSTDDIPPDEFFSLTTWIIIGIVVVVIILLIICICCCIAKRSKIRREKSSELSDQSFKKPASSNQSPETPLSPYQSPVPLLSPYQSPVPPYQPPGYLPPPLIPPSNPVDIEDQA